MKKVEISPIFVIVMIDWLQNVVSCPIWSVVILVISGMWPQGTTDHVNFLFHNFSRIKNVVCGWGRGTTIYGLYRIKVCAAVKGMVFKQFTLGYGI